MKIISHFSLIMVLFFLGGCLTSNESFTVTYPEAERLEHYEQLHGYRVHDPYRWLESIDSDQTKKWLDDQRELTANYLSSISQRSTIKERFKELLDYDKYSTPTKKEDRYFYTLKKGLQSHSVVYWQQGLDGEPQVLIDPNTFSKDKTVSLADHAVSHNGEFVAYSISRSGSDWKEIKIRHVSDGIDFKDHLKWVKFSGVSWSLDNKGFYYSRYDAPQKGKEDYKSVNFYQKLYYHRLGTDQSEDQLVYERKDKKRWGFDAEVTEDGRYLVFKVSQGTSRKNGVFFIDLKDPNKKVVELLNEFDAQYKFVANDGPIFYFHTDYQASLYRVISININEPVRHQWKEVIPERRETLKWVGFVAGQFVASYLKNAHALIKLFDRQGKYLRDVTLPGIGSARWKIGHSRDRHSFYSFSSFNVPTTIYRYDHQTGKSTLYRESQIDYDPKDIVVKQVYCYSKDKTVIPIFICHKKDIKLDGSNPTYLTGYGGFNIPLTPRFNAKNILWMEMGGIYAMANIRGGGEYGRKWHQAGTVHNKQNVFDDFIAASEYLIENGYTSEKKLAIIGGSNGGLLVGACMTQRPDLFGACIPRVGVLDMIRFHKFTIGWAWSSDYGSPEKKDEFETLFKYSPYHNVKKGLSYPPTLITTADHDDRVYPSHSFKFAAALQHAQTGENPILIRVQAKLGHGRGQPTQMVVNYVADELAFLVRTLDIDI